MQIMKISQPENYIAYWWPFHLWIEDWNGCCELFLRIWRKIKDGKLAPMGSDLVISNSENMFIDLTKSTLFLNELFWHSCFCKKNYSKVCPSLLVIVRDGIPGVFYIRSCPPGIEIECLAVSFLRLFVLFELCSVK